MIGTNTEETAEALWRDLYPSGRGIGVTAKFLHFLYRHTHSRADIDAALSLLRQQGRAGAYSYPSRRYAKRWCRT